MANNQGSAAQASETPKRGAARSASALTRDNEVSRELMLQAMTSTVIYTLPNGELRSALVARVLSPALADIRVACAGDEDAKFFHGHFGGGELVNRAPYSSEVGIPETWTFDPASQIATLWPRS